MRYTWSGYIKLSLVTIPVKMYNTVAKKKIQFHLLHKACKNRIKQEKVCPVCDKTLTADEIIRGYEYAKDSYVLITDEDLEKAKKESTEAIEILKVVDDRQINPIYYSESHYLVPDGKIGVEAFAIFHKAMLETEKTALAKVVIRNQEHLLAIKPQDGALIAYTLHFPEEIQDIDSIEESKPVKKVEINPKSLAMAKDILQNMSGDFKPEEYTDEYAEAILQLAEAKSRGEEIKVEPRVARANVINLMDALKKSVQETKQKTQNLTQVKIGLRKKSGQTQVKQKRTA
jgi:DNA end-binding protein Ku